MEINGKLEAKFETKEFSSGFRKREFVINTGGEYPQAIKMEVVKDNIEKLDAIEVGTEVTCKIDIRGRLYEGNYYNNILAWAVNVGATTNTEKASEKKEVESDLPF
jgi:single-strand DNA-binding protein|tara:strand:+ start:851 stop:1168 length:318 start_codon:yes stop_codon:yes gene_type:complete